jgi:hypothetical protein
MHCALVETMGTQTDKQKSSNKEMRAIINTVRKEAERLTKSGPKTNTFRKFRQVLSENNRPVVTEADLEGMTLSHQRVLLEGKREMAFCTDVSQRWVRTIVMLMQLLTNWRVLTLMYTTGDRGNPLEDEFSVILEVFSICFRVLVFLRLSEGCIYLPFFVREHVTIPLFHVVILEKNICFMMRHQAFHDESTQF